MRRLFPEFAEEVEPLAEYSADERPAPPHRPWVALNMVSSVDGAISVDGRSGGLASPADKAVFTALRAVPDIILAGSGTVLAEDYRPPRATEEVRAVRRARGQAEVPRLAIVTARLPLEPAHPVFGDPANRPLLITTPTAPPDRLDALGAVADILAPGDGPDVDLVAALTELRAHHATVLVLCEGGPTLNGTLHDAGLVDELCLSLSPALAGGDSSRIVAGGLAALRPLELRRVLEQDSMLFLRYVVAHEGPRPS